MTSIKELATIFGGVIAEYVNCPDFDEKREPESELLKSLIKALLQRKQLTDEQIDYSCSPVLHRGIKWDIEAFRDACESGQLGFAKWLDSIITLYSTEEMIDINRIFKLVCANGHLEVAKWLFDTWAEVDPLDDTSIYDLLCWAVNKFPNDMDKWLKLNKRYFERGYIDLYEWEIDTKRTIDWVHSYEPEIIQCDGDRYVFLKVCENGHFHIAQWLKTHWPDIDHRIENDLPFREACANGHFEIAKWLHVNWPDINPRANNDWAFRHACANGHLEVAKWLKANWSDIDHRACNDEAFRMACANGHLNVAKWLKEQWPDIDHRALNDYAFRESRNHEYHYVAEWLIEQWPEFNNIDEEDIEV